MMDEILLRIILEDDYKKFITDAVRYFKDDEECMVTDSTEIIKAMSIATILIGFTKKPVNLDEYNVKLKNRNLKVNTKDFCIKFKEYIEKVEKVKLDMLKEIT
ncbi:MAG: hypothetical protein E7313_07260 [Clostridiales bacterium]|nr:hypothetical protein [Clostridiales bacterium]